MHEFALLAFGGLVTALIVRLVSQYGRDAARLVGSLVLSMALGVGYAYLVDFQIFSAWGVDARSDTIATIVTGLMVGGLAMLWEEVIDFFHRYGHRHDEPTSLRRAA